MRIESKNITVCAVAVALMFALAWMPVAAFLVPALFVACNYKWKHGLIVGTFAGFVCLSYAFIAGAANNSPIVVVIICIVWVIPRALVGLFASLACSGARKVIKSEKRIAQFMPYHIAASVGVLTNTVLMVFSLLVFFPQMIIMGITVATGWWILLLIGLIELVVMNILIPPLCLTVGKALKIGEFAQKKIEVSKDIE